MKANNGSRVLVTASGKKIVSTKQIQFLDKENKKLILWSDGWGRVVDLLFNLFHLYF